MALFATTTIFAETIEYGKITRPPSYHERQKRYTNQSKDYCEMDSVLLHFGNDVSPSGTIFQGTPLNIMKIKEQPENICYEISRLIPVSSTGNDPELSNFWVLLLCGSGGSLGR